jgi:MtN3 and saliva related transmembrane protein
MIDLTLAGIVGTLTVLMALLVKFVGFPDQMRKNYKRKSTKGVSTIFYILAFIGYSLWVVHGILQQDNVLIIGQGLGVITTAIILGQIFMYRDN